MELHSGMIAITLVGGTMRHTFLSLRRATCLVALLLASVCAFFVLPASGQATNGSIYGTVTDTSGAFIPGAAIVVTNVHTSASKNAKAAVDGDYSFPVLEPGDYEVNVQMAGFQSQTQKGIRLDASQN